MGVRKDGPGALCDGTPPAKLPNWKLPLAAGALPPPKVLGADAAAEPGCWPKPLKLLTAGWVWFAKAGTEAALPKGWAWPPPNAGPDAAALKAKPVNAGVGFGAVARPPPTAVGGAPKLIAAADC